MGYELWIDGDGAVFDAIDGFIAGGFGIRRQGIAGVISDHQTAILQLQYVLDSAQCAGFIILDHFIEHAGPIVDLAGDHQCWGQRGLVLLGAKP